MKVSDFISALDEARYGNHGLQEDDAVAEAPSHAPTKTSQWKTPSTGKSEDHGERMGGEKDAIKQSKNSIPAPVAKSPSHAPTSGKDYTTTGKGGSEDQGEKISKEAVKEELIHQLIDAEDEDDISAIMAEAELTERGAHKSGCKCGFCLNKSSFGKKKEEGADDKKSDMSEAMPMRRPSPRAGFGVPAKKGITLRGKIGKPKSVGAPTMGFRHPSSISPRPKAIVAPYQPSMENAARRKTGKSVQEMADELLESPE